MRKARSVKRKKKITPVPKVPLAYWLSVVESLIGKHSTAPRKSGKHKGHATTDTQAWVRDLSRMVERYIGARNRGLSYDGNMAQAALLGLILSAWYANVHRAKCYDPNRPLRLRRQAYARLEQHRALLVRSLFDDRLMAKVWGQSFNPPWGWDARGGAFV